MIFRRPRFIARERHEELLRDRLEREYVETVGDLVEVLVGHEDVERSSPPRRRDRHPTLDEVWALRSQRRRT